MNHPGFLALDRYALAPEPGPVAAHLERCADCARHVQLVQTAVTPSFELGPRPPAPRRLLRFGKPLTVALMAAAALFLALLVPRQLGKETITPKSANPTAVLWVSHEGAVHVWQGERVHLGASVRFEVAPAGFKHLAVVDLSPSPHILYAASIAGSEPTLSPAWKVDASTSRNELAVVLTVAPIGDADLPSLVCHQSARAWCTQFTVEQEP